MIHFFNRPSLKSIRLIYCGLILGLVLFSTMSFSLIHSSGTIGNLPPEITFYLLIVANLLPAIAIPTGLFVARKRLCGIEKTASDEKLRQFQSAIIVRAATIEGSGYFMLACFALTGHHAFFLEALAMLALQIYFFPGNTRIARELKSDLCDLSDAPKMETKIPNI
ncbi:hypothetical protein C8N47_107113 [Mangrovibacterium marinum]|uniref:Uncharacterized protein n=1 Tax=Mangrovibacterium marinum TaxID=1639118 RepID=A0A2T5C236_9BACT|nr:hypothetical protein [Mangrovibacterium marinum]PTN08753.1 hypothetical protein C8N47_107113 [Mangrovibacterium marinum]